MKKESKVKIGSTPSYPNEGNNPKRPPLQEWSNEAETFRREFEASAKPINLKLMGLFSLLVILLYGFIGVVTFLLRQFPDKGLDIFQAILLWFKK